MFQGKTKTKNKTVKYLAPDQEAANFFSKGLDKYFLGFVEYVISVTPLKRSHGGIESSNKQEGNK